MSGLARALTPTYWPAERRWGRRGTAEEDTVHNNQIGDGSETMTAVATPITTIIVGKKRNSSKGAGGGGGGEAITVIMGGELCHQF
jgi:hypothetical protein